MLISKEDAIEIINDMLKNDTESITEDQCDAIKIALKALQGVPPIAVPDSGVLEENPPRYWMNTYTGHVQESDYPGLEFEEIDEDLYYKKIGKDYA